MLGVLENLLGVFRRHGATFVLSGASQALSSLTNFGIVLYLLRVLDKEQFGLFGLGFAISFALAGLLAALYAVQLVVNLPDQLPLHRRVYAIQHTTALIATGLGMLAVMALLVGVLGSATDATSVDFSLGLPVVFSATAFATRDILVRIAYVERRESMVLLSNFFVALAVIAAFGGAAICNWRVDAAHALYAYGIGQLAGIPLLLLILDLPWRDLKTDGLKNAVAHSWRGGRWHVLTNFVHSARTQGHNFVIAPLVGLAAIAEVNSARTLLTPAVMLIPPIYQIMMPRLAERRAQGVPAILRAASHIAIVLASGSIIYSIALLLLLDRVQPLLLGPAYDDAGKAVVAWSAVTVLMAVRNGLTMAQEALKSFRALFVTNTLTAIVAVGFAVLFTIRFGAVGAIWALAGAELVLCLLLARGLFGRQPQTMRWDEIEV